MHRRRARRRDADRSDVRSHGKPHPGHLQGPRDSNWGHSPRRSGSGLWKHWRLANDADGVAWLLFDREDASANTLSAEVIEELDGVLAAARTRPAAGLAIRSAKPSGFIAGADVNAFRGAPTQQVEAAISRAHP